MTEYIYFIYYLHNLNVAHFMCLYFVPFVAIDYSRGDNITLVKIPKNKELTNLYKFCIYRRYNLINYSQ